MSTNVTPAVMSPEAKTWERSLVIMNPAAGVIPLSLETARPYKITRVVYQFLTGTLDLELLSSGVPLDPFGTMGVTSTKTATTGEGAVPGGNTLSLNIANVSGTGTFAVTVWGVSDDAG